MRMINIVLPVIAMGFTAGSAMAATSAWSIDGTNAVPNTLAHALHVDGEGDDWTGAVLRIDLTSGSIYNDPGFDSDAIQPALWGFVPLLRWDSWVGVEGDGTGGIAGGAGDLGCAGQSLAGTGVCAGSVTWFNTDISDTGPIQIANITLPDDAQGTWELIVSFAGGQIRSSGVFEIPEPASLALMSLGGLAVLRRRKV